MGALLYVTIQGSAMALGVLATSGLWGWLIRGNSACPFPQSVDFNNLGSDLSGGQGHSVLWPDLCIGLGSCLGHHTSISLS